MPLKVPSIAALNNGDYVVSWASSSSDGTGYNVFAQRFSPDGVRLGPELRLSEFDVDWHAAFQGPGALAGLTGGGFVAAWPVFVVHDDNTGSSSIFVRIYDANGGVVASTLGCSRVSVWPGIFSCSMSHQVFGRRGGRYCVTSMVASPCQTSSRRRISSMLLMRQNPATAISTMPANTDGESR